MTERANPNYLIDVAATQYNINPEELLFGLLQQQESGVDVMVGAIIADGPKSFVVCKALLAHDGPIGLKRLQRVVNGVIRQVPVEVREKVSLQEMGRNILEARLKLLKERGIVERGKGGYYLSDRGRVAVKDATTL